MDALIGKVGCIMENSLFVRLVYCLVYASLGTILWILSLILYLDLYLHLGVYAS